MQEGDITAFFEKLKETNCSALLYLLTCETHCPSSCELGFISRQFRPPEVTRKENKLRIVESLHGYFNSRHRLHTAMY